MAKRLKGLYSGFSKKIKVRFTYKQSNEIRALSRQMQKRLKITPQQATREAKQRYMESHPEDISMFAGSRKLHTEEYILENGVILRANVDSSGVAIDWEFISTMGNKSGGSPDSIYDEKDKNIATYNMFQMTSLLEDLRKEKRQR